MLIHLHFVNLAGSHGGMPSVNIICLAVAIFFFGFHVAPSFGNNEVCKSMVQNSPIDAIGVVR